jgi:hypothetical protein
MKKLWINDREQGKTSDGDNDAQEMHATFKGFPHIHHCPKVTV